jgi:calmodulin
MTGVNEDDVADLRESFDYFDKDDNGSIDRAEFAALLAALSDDFSRREADIGFDAIDVDHSGRISFDEFLAWWTEQ